MLARDTANMIKLRYSLFWDVTQCGLVITDVSGQPILKRQAVQQD